MVADAFGDGGRVDLSRIVGLAESSGERFVLADHNVVVLNLDDYEDMLFMADEKIQGEVEAGIKEYEESGGIDYLEYRGKRLGR